MFLVYKRVSTPLLGTLSFYGSPFIRLITAFEGEVIPEVASFKEEGLVTPEG